MKLILLLLITLTTLINLLIAKDLVPSGVHQVIQNTSSFVLSPLGLLLTIGLIIFFIATNYEFKSSEEMAQEDVFDNLL